MIRFLFWKVGIQWTFFCSRLLPRSPFADKSWLVSGPHRPHTSYWIPWVDSKRQVLSIPLIWDSQKCPVKAVKVMKFVSSVWNSFSYIYIYIPSLELSHIPSHSGTIGVDDSYLFPNCESSKVGALLKGQFITLRILGPQIRHFEYTSENTPKTKYRCIGRPLGGPWGILRAHSYPCMDHES